MTDEPISVPSRIERPNTLDDLRGVEHMGMLRNRDVDTLAVDEDTDASDLPCVFCNPPELVAERGIVWSEVSLVDGGDPVAGCCRMCITDAPEVDA